MHSDTMLSKCGPLAFHYADFPITLRPNSRYPLHKFSLLRDSVVREGLFPPAHVISGEPASFEMIALAHTEDYIRKVRDDGLDERQLREMGFLWSENLYLRGAAIAGSTIANASSAREFGVSFTLGGGAHHAFHDRGRGYCIFNDVAIATRHLLKTNSASRVAILDCDVHQGDGTAAILSDDTQAFTCSIHGAKNYPFRKETSSLDIELGDACGDEAYLEACARGVEATLHFKPDHFFYIAGADPFEEDRLGRLRISASGLIERDRLVFSALRERQIPTSVVFGGGYCDPIEGTVARNLETLRIALELFR